MGREIGLKLLGPSTSSDKSQTKLHLRAGIQGYRKDCFYPGVGNTSLRPSTHIHTGLGVCLDSRSHPREQDCLNTGKHSASHAWHTTGGRNPWVGLG